MRVRFLYVTLLILFVFPAFAQKQLPLLPAKASTLTRADWLVNAPPISAGLYRSADGSELVLYNGWLKRSFRMGKNLVCSEFLNMRNGQQLLRAISPEAELMIDGRAYAIGGLRGQKEKAYLLPEWIDQMEPGEKDFAFTHFDTASLQQTVSWKSTGWWMPEQTAANGLELRLHFKSSEERLAGLKVVVHYLLYQGLPLLCKWVSVENGTGRTLRVDRLKNEILALVEEESAVVGRPEQMKTQQGIYVETNYAFNNAMRYAISDQTTHWITDSTYSSQVNYNYETPCILEVYPDHAPGIDLLQGEQFESVRSYELLMDSYDRERRGIAIRKMYRTIAPWVTANPIFMHLVSSNDQQVRTAIDQCAGTGYEAVILSFGSHCNMEDSSAANISRWKALADYAHQRNIKIGSYALFSSRRISDADDVINPATGKPGGAFFGNAPCFGSKWGLAFRDKIKYFFEKTGFDIWENDGPYPGDRCASTNHPGHQGLDDSQWKQMQIQKELYRWLNERGVYINAPDWYFLDGTHKIAIGYREVNFSLPRENQKILNRQNIYDGTWEKTPSMGWGFVPLTRYQGGGPEAILEPLQDHLNDYVQLMMQYYGAGVQACYRGPRLFDTDRTRDSVRAVINWYKKYRDILNADIIHLRRADGRDWDGILHVSPIGKLRGLFMLFNPLAKPVTRTIELPVYYTGLHQKLKLREKEGQARVYQINRDFKCEVTVTIPANGYSWWVIEQP
ncbi:MAG: alpha-galactosidase [Chitinophagaceae bacterium]